jgi:hypothetical protein
MRAPVRLAHISIALMIGPLMSSLSGNSCTIDYALPSCAIPPHSLKGPIKCLPLPPNGRSQHPIRVQFCTRPKPKCTQVLLINEKKNTELHMETTDALITFIIYKGNVYYSNILQYTFSISYTSRRTSVASHYLTLIRLAANTTNVTRQPMTF